MGDYLRCRYQENSPRFRLLPYRYLKTWSRMLLRYILVILTNFHIHVFLLAIFIETMLSSFQFQVLHLSLIHSRVLLLKVTYSLAEILCKKNAFRWWRDTSHFSSRLYKLLLRKTKDQSKSVLTKSTIRFSKIVNNSGNMHIIPWLRIIVYKEVRWMTWGIFNLLIGSAGKTLYN